MRARLTDAVRRVQTWNRVRSPWGRTRNLVQHIHAETRETLRAVANLHHDVRHALDVLRTLRTRVDAAHRRLDSLDSRFEALEMHAVESRLGEEWVILMAESELVRTLRDDEAAMLDEWVADHNLTLAPAIAVHRQSLAVKAAALGSWHGPLAWTWTDTTALWPFPLAVPPPYVPADAP